MCCLYGFSILQNKEKALSIGHLEINMSWNIEVFIIFHDKKSTYRRNIFLNTAICHNTKEAKQNRISFI